MKSNCIITKENYYADIAKMANLLAIDAANTIIAGFKTGKGQEDPFSDIRQGCSVSILECSHCAHTGKCHLQLMRSTIGDVIEVATNNVISFFEDNTKWEGGQQ